MLVILFLLLGTAGRAQVIPGQVDSLHLAYEYEARGQYDRAIAVLQVLAEKDPLNINYYITLRRNLLRLQRLSALEALIEKRLKLRNDIMAHVDYADLLYRRGEEREALAAWNALLERNSRSVDAYTLVAQRLIENQLFDEAIEVYTRGREELNNTSLFVFQIADLHVARQNYREATRENLRYLKTSPQQWAVVQSRLSGYARTAEIVREIDDILIQELSVPSLEYQIRTLLGSLYLRVAAFREAYDQYVLIDSLAAGDSQAQLEGTQLFQFAETARAEEEYGLAQMAYQHLIARHPESPLLSRAKFALASIHKDQGDYEDAIKGFEEVAAHFKKTREGYEALFALADIWFTHLHDIEQCEGVLTRLLAESPAYTQRQQAVLMYGDCQLVKGEFEKAAALYRSAATQRQGNLTQVVEQSLFKMGELALFLGESDTALTKLSALTTMALPKNSPSSGQLVNDALKLIFVIRNSAGEERALTTYARALLYSRQWQEGKALDVLYELVQQFPEAAILPEALLEIGSIEMRLQRTEEALVAFERILAGGESCYLSDCALKKKGEVYELRGEVKEAQTIYEELLEKYPHSIYIEEVRKKIRSLAGSS